MTPAKLSVVSHSLSQALQTNIVILCQISQRVINFPAYNLSYLQLFPQHETIYSQLLP